MIGNKENLKAMELCSLKRKIALRVNIIGNKRIDKALYSEANEAREGNDIEAMKVVIAKLNRHMEQLGL